MSFSETAKKNLQALLPEIEVPFCEQCTAHCCKAPHRAHLHEKERLSGRYEFEFLAPDLQLLAVLRHVNGRCLYLTDGGKCSIFATRPQTCRAYDCRIDPQMRGLIPEEWLSIYAKPENSND